MAARERASESRRRSSRDEEDEDDGPRRSTRKGGKKYRGYKARSVESVTRHAEQTGGSFMSIFKDVDIWRPGDGESQIRILPPTWEGADHYGMEVWVHKYIGNGGDYLCPIKMGTGSKCEACAEAKALRDDDEGEKAKKLDAKRAFACYIIDRDDKKKKPRPQAWMMGWQQDKDIAIASSSRRKGTALMIDDPDDGHDVIINKSGKGLNTRYTFQIESEKTPACDDEDEQDDVLDQIENNPIDSILKTPDNEAIKKALAGGERDKDEDLDEDEDENPRRRRGSSRRSRDDDEGEDESPRRSRSRRRDDADEDEEDPDDNPRSRRRRGNKEDDDGEDDDEKPARSRARGKGRSKADNEDDDGEDERPSRNRRGARSDADDDEGGEDRGRQTRGRNRRSRDEDESEEGDDEDEKPARRRSR